MTKYKKMTQAEFIQLIKDVYHMEAGVCWEQVINEISLSASRSSDRLHELKCHSNAECESRRANHMYIALKTRGYYDQDDC